MASKVKNDSERLVGYAECHFCTVEAKRKSWRCAGCVGRFSLRERLVRRAEDGKRRVTAAFISLLAPGLGHVYRKSPGTGFFYFFILAFSVGFLLVIEGDWTSGRYSLVGTLVLLYFACAWDASRPLRENDPPCQEACPAGLACSLYVGLTREEKYREALEMVETLCPFPGTVGRVCHHPCEKACRRGIEGESVAICALKRYLADESGEETASFYLDEAGSAGCFKEKVAVVGGGPAGLSAALYLQILGFSVTLIEGRDELGGMPHAVIPDYRLPGYVYSGEIERIVSTGIEVRTGKWLGKDFSLDDLRSEGFKAAFLALGAQRTVRLPHCGSPEEGFLDGIEFLRAAKKGTAGMLEGHVIVIGGGNVAVDVAKTAVRLGAKTVRKVFLESRETMPAHQWECEEALEEGVKLIPSSATISFEKEEGRVVSALCRKVERIDFDKNGRMKPVLWDGTDFTLEANWVITAVGTGPDYSLFDGRPAVKQVRKNVRAGRVKVSNLKGMHVLMGGDYFAGPASVIEAVAAGTEAAMEIYRRLGKATFLRLPAWNRMRPIRYPGYQDGPSKVARVSMTRVDPEVRCESFCEVCEAYDPPSARDEGSRCLRCCWPIAPLKKLDESPLPPAKPVEPAPAEKGSFF